MRAGEEIDALGAHVIDLVVELVGNQPFPLLKPPNAKEVSNHAPAHVRHEVDAVGRPLGDKVEGVPAHEPSRQDPGGDVQDGGDGREEPHESSNSRLGHQVGGEPDDAHDHARVAESGDPIVGEEGI